MDLYTNMAIRWYVLHICIVRFQKAQQELEDSVVITDSLNRVKMMNEYSNDEKCPFLDNDLQIENNMNKKTLEKEDVLQLKSMFRLNLCFVISPHSCDLYLTDK